MEATYHTIFTKSRTQGVRFAFFVLLAIACMVADRKLPEAKYIHSYLSVAVSPVQFLVDGPVEFFDWASVNISTQRALIEENAHLRAEQILLKAQLQKFMALEKENRQLRALLQSSTHTQGKVVVAQMLAVATDPYSQEIVVDKGSKQGVYVGQPVLDASGVLGQVIAAGPLTSRIMLITDRRSAIPVINNTNGERAIVSGTGVNSHLEVINTPQTVAIKVGDMLVTSGLGQRFPAGYPVGTVAKVMTNPGDHFAKIWLTPAAHINSARLVLLVWPQRVKAVKREVKQMLRASKHQAITGIKLASAKPKVDEHEA